MIATVPSLSPHYSASSTHEPPRFVLVSLDPPRRNHGALEGPSDSGGRPCCWVTIRGRCDDRVPSGMVEDACKFRSFDGGLGQDGPCLRRRADELDLRRAEQLFAVDCEAAPVWSRRRRYGYGAVPIWLAGDSLLQRELAVEQDAKDLSGLREQRQLQ